MPEAIQVYKDSGSLLEVDIIKQSILLSYRDDFSKYGRRFKHSIIQKVFQKFVLYKDEIQNWLYSL